MNELRELFEHNGWANDRVFELCGRLAPELADVEAPGTRGTVRGTLAHLAAVEELYLGKIEDRDVSFLVPGQPYHEQAIDWFRRRLQEAAREFVQVVELADEAVLARELTLPWLDFPLRVRDGLLQVLSHSAQHRSQVLSWLGARGVDVPDLDYVLMLRERRV